MAANPSRIAFKRAIERLSQPNAEPLVMKHSPFAESLEAAILSLDLEKRTLRARFNPGRQYLQGAGVLQGGILATMLDFSMAFVSLSVLPEELSCATAQLNVHYLRPANPGLYYAHAEVEKAGKRVLFNRAMLIPAEGGDPVASATATFTGLGN